MYAILPIDTFHPDFVSGTGAIDQMHITPLKLLMLTILIAALSAPAHAQDDDDPLTIVYVSADNRLSMRVPDAWVLSTFVQGDLLQVSYRNPEAPVVLAGRMDFYFADSLQDFELDTLSASELLEFTLPGYLRFNSANTLPETATIRILENESSEIAVTRVSIDGDNPLTGAVGVVKFASGDVLYFKSTAPLENLDAYNAFHELELAVLSTVTVNQQAARIRVFDEPYIGNNDRLQINAPSTWDRGNTAGGFTFIERRIFDYTYTLTFTLLDDPDLATVGVTATDTPEAAIEDLIVQLSQSADAVDAGGLDSFVIGNGAAIERTVLTVADGTATYGGDWRVDAIGVLTLTNTGEQVLYTASIDGAINAADFERFHQYGRQIIGTLVVVSPVG